MMRQYHRVSRHAFTMLELSVVLAIIALIAGVGMNMASGALKAADRVTTQERMNTIKIALDSFAKNYGYLPCPADRKWVPTDAAFGIESRSPTNPATCIGTSPSIVHPAGAETPNPPGNPYPWLGGVPVRTLGLPDTYAGDAWGGKIDYTVATMSQNPSTYATQMPGVGIMNGGWYLQPVRISSVTFSASNNGSGKVRLTVTSGYFNVGNTIITLKGSVYNGSYVANYISSTQYDLLATPYTSSDTGTMFSNEIGYGGATYALISHGANQKGAFPINGSSIPNSKKCSSGSLGEQFNCGALGTQIVNDYTFNDATPASFFDDYVTWGGSEMQRAPDIIATTMYTSCPVAVGACEPWCATCTVNYPGGGSVAPPASITNPFIYKKVLTGNSTSCSATCFWGGTNGSGVWMKAP